MEISQEWEELSFLSSQRDCRRKNKDLRWCPGVYKPTGEYNDVWTKWFLENRTPYNTFQELWNSGDVEFMFEKRKDG